MYAIVDCDNCFVSCERVFQPDLKGRPVVVLSNNDGCVVARSNEAKRLGVKMGVPIYQIKDMVDKHGIEIRSSNYILYADMSNRVMSILRNEMTRTDSPIIVEAVEQYSIDEAFLTVSEPATPTLLSASTSSPSPLRQWGEALVAKIGQWTGMPVSIGIAQTRTLAKAATWYAKHYAGYKKVCIIQSEEQREKALKGLEVGEVWGVGWRSIEKYRYFGIETAWDLTQRSASWIRQHFTVTGLRTWQELSGTSCIETVETNSKQTICTSRSFDGMISDLNVLEMHVSNYASHCAEKLRRQRSVCNIVTCFCQTNHHRLDLAQMDAALSVTLATPAASAHEITAAALRALRAIWRAGYQYKRAGVIVSGISSDSAVQQDIFDPLTPEQRQKLNRISQIMDIVNRRHGNDTIQLGVQLFPIDPKTGERSNFRDLIRHEYRSRCYTTNFDDIIEAK